MPHVGGTSSFVSRLTEQEWTNGDSYLFSNLTCIELTAVQPSVQKRERKDNVAAIAWLKYSLSTAGA